MKLRVLSDLHIEFNKFEVPPLPNDAETTLVLAGDIGVIKKRESLEEFLHNCAKQFKNVIYVLGNHEYYASVWPNALEDHLISWGLPSNIYILDSDYIEFDDCYFIGATLWADFDKGCPISMRDSAASVNDFRYIMTDPEEVFDNRYIFPEDLLECFNKTIRYLDKELEQIAKNNKFNKPVILITHHGISKQSIHEDYKNSTVNGSFVSDCEWLIKKHKPELAIHGHVHNNFDYLIPHEQGATRVIVNPRGYTNPNGSSENPNFDPKLFIEL